MLKLKLLDLKIEVLKSILNKRLELNNYIVNEEIIFLSMQLDQLIVERQCSMKKSDKRNSKDRSVKLCTNYSIKMFT